MRRIVDRLHVELPPAHPTARCPGSRLTARLGWLPCRCEEDVTAYLEVQASNQPALSLYQRFNFDVVRTPLAPLQHGDFVDKLL
jgi:hypothetical protein